MKTTKRNSNLFQQRLEEGARDVAIEHKASVSQVRQVCQRISSNGFDTDTAGHSVNTGKHKHIGICECVRTELVLMLNTGATCMAIYAFTALMNHSCEPSAEVAPAKVERARLHTRARRCIMPGDEINFNYGPPPLIDEWSLGQRREYMFSHHYFVCGCSRCNRESGVGQ